MTGVGIDPGVAKARSRVAVAVRRRDPEARREAQRELAAAKIADFIQRTVDSAPPLSREQLDRLGLLLRGGDAA